ncbi:MAG: pilus assembly protein [Anaerolineae bacterium]|nr:pilus assembly protein [Anaerolineae bacterium]
MLKVRPRHEHERGQGLVEYALLLIFVAVVLIAILAVLSPGIANIYSGIINTL